MKRNVAFYLPSNIYGGTELLFFRLIDVLSQLYCVRVYTAKNSVFEQMYDYSDKPNITVHYDVREADNELFVISSKYVMDLYRQLNGSTNVNKFIIWQLQPIEFIYQFFPFFYGLKCKIVREVVFSLCAKFLMRKRFIALQEFVELAINSQSMLFMDGENATETMKYIGTNNGHFSYFPVCIPFHEGLNKKIMYNTGSNPNDSISVIIVSRLSFDFKAYPICSVVESMSQYCQKNRMYATLNIVGNGEAEEYLREVASRFKNCFLNIRFHGFLDNLKVVELFYKGNVNLAFGMGTSLIDSSMFTIPTICMNPCDIPQAANKVKYQWFYENTDFCLGGYEANENARYFDIIMDEYRQKATVHGVACYRYAEKNHSFDSLVTKFELIINQSPGVDLVPFVSKVESSSKFFFSVMHFNARVLKYIKHKFSI
ncbi:hypothetical protein OPFLODJI_01357 [Aeromonas hydrophila]|uniref:hypothetical protein n=1 Tax=Aeromonas hydrophila TaxID=644 RepID=UPI00366C7B7D